MTNEQLLSLENNATVIINMRKHKCLMDTHLVFESPPVSNHPVLTNEGLISPLLPSPLPNNRSDSIVTSVAKVAAFPTYCTLMCHIFLHFSLLYFSS